MIEVDGLTRYYGTFPAVRDVTFTVKDQAVVGFLGLNGAGKSTVLKVLAGLLMPSEGSVRVAGIDAIENPDVLRTKIGFLPEDPPLYREMKVRDFLLWCGRIKGLSSDRLQARTEKVMELCHIKDREDALIETLSHGYRKRVGIAQAIIHEPALVILDEPISGLDPVQIVEMREVLRNLARSCTVFVSSHILSEISQTCDRILVLHNGRVVADGTEEDLRQRMSSSRGLTMEVRGKSTDVEAALADLPLTSIQVDDRPGGLLNIELRMEKDCREEIVASLVRAGIGVRRMDAKAEGLESVFLGLTKEEQPPAQSPPRATEEVLEVAS